MVEIDKHLEALIIDAVMPARRNPNLARLVIQCFCVFACFAPHLEARTPGDDPPTPSGTYGSGVELKLNGSVILYGLDVPSSLNGGAGILVPNGSSATFDPNSWANGTETSPVLNLGSFDPGLGQTLFLTGGSLLTFNGDTYTVTVGYLDFRIFPQGTPSGLFTEFSLPLDDGAVSGISSRKRWSSESQTFDLLSGLPPGDYVLGVYLHEKDSGNQGAFSRFNGQNFGATFSVVPEPSSLGLIAVSLLGASLFLLKRGAAKSSGMSASVNADGK